MIPKYIFVYIHMLYYIIYFELKINTFNYKINILKKKTCLFNNLNFYHIFLVAYNLGEINSEIKMYELT